MIPAVFSPYADRTPKLRRVSLRRLGSMLHSSSVWLGHVEAPRQPAPREINARRCRRGSCSPSVASHGARGSEWGECFYPSYLALKSGAASRREASRHVRPSPEGFRSQKPARVNLCGFFRISPVDFCCGIRVGGAAPWPTTRSRNSPRRGQAARAQQPSTRTGSHRSQPPLWPPTARSTSSSTSTASGMLIYLVGASTWCARP